MNAETRTAIIAAATTHAARLCEAALAFLAAGRKTFVKGKAVIVPWTDEKRAEMKRLQLTAFDGGMSMDARLLDALEPFVVAEGITEETEDAFVDEARALYVMTGRAVVERLFA